MWGVRCSACLTAFQSASRLLTHGRLTAELSFALPVSSPSPERALLAGMALVSIGMPWHVPRSGNDAGNDAGKI
jgi:hypothetical protein